MNQHIKNPYVWIILFSVLLHACGTSSDTIVVVQDTPRTGASETEEIEEADAEEFMQLNIGLLDTVTNFDPLHAWNLSTKRVLGLIYQGLVTLDQNGEPMPAIAREIDISDDGLEYTFTINRDIIYHDSPAFPAGIGRRVHAADVEWAFMRAAERHFPEDAARLLMGIKGFENYFLEQRTIFDPERRVLAGITGIQVLNAETVVIELIEEDPEFLKKLSSPLLMIYPREAVLNSEQGIAARPVGSGHYRLNRIENDGTIILSRADREQNMQPEHRPRINRIDLINAENETVLFQQFAAGEIDWIPEISPEITQQVTDQDFNIQMSYRDLYKLTPHNGVRSVSFYLHEGAAVNHEWLKSRLALLTAEDLPVAGDVTLNTDRFEINENAIPEENYFLVFTEDHTARMVYEALHGLLFQPESSLVFLNIQVPIRTASLYTTTSDSIHREWAFSADNEYWLRIDKKILSLYQRYVTGIEPSAVPWLLHIEHVRVQNRD